MSTTNEHHMIHGHGSWNIICNTEFVVILGLFLLFHPRDDPENQSFEKLKKIPRDVTILHMCIINDIWCMHLPFLSFYFYPPNNPENLNFEKMKKTPGDIIILQMRIINDNIMTKWQDFFSFFFFFIFGRFLLHRKIKIFQKMKKYLGISLFYTRVPKIMIICYNVPQIQRVTDVIFIFHFGLYFSLLPL